MSERVGKTLPYDNLNALRAKMIADHPTFGGVDYAPAATTFDPGKLGKAGPLSGEAILPAFEDFYFTNPIARASRIMAECSRETRGGEPKLRAAE